MKDLIIIGAGGHGRVVADIAQKLGVYENISFLDDDDLKESMGLAIVGKTSDFDKYIKTADIFVAIGNSKVRASFIKKLIEKDASIPTLIHPSAVIGACVEVGIGTAIMAGAIINPCSKIGIGVIVNTSSSIDHDCVIGDYVHVSVGAHVAGSVMIGKNVLVGTGAVVVKDIVDSGTYVGVPAKKM